MSILPPQFSNRLYGGLRNRAPLNTLMFEGLPEPVNRGFIVELMAAGPSESMRKNLRHPHYGRAHPIQPRGYLTHFRALRQICIQGLNTLMSPCVHDICTLRKTRSACGIMAVKRPSAVVTAVSPPGLPFGFSG